MDHDYNPTFSGGRNQEDPGWKLTLTSSSRDPIMKTPNTKIGLVEWFKF
jgi:hypothetical protein